MGGLVLDQRLLLQETLLEQTTRVAFTERVGGADERDGKNGEEDCAEKGRQRYRKGDD